LCATNNSEQTDETNSTANFAYNRCYSVYIGLCKLFS